jgi:hypothetical protein
MFTRSSRTMGPRTEIHRAQARRRARSKAAWPFLWYENEYLLDAAAAFILAASAAQALTHSTQSRTEATPA